MSFDPSLISVTTSIFFFVGIIMVAIHKKMGAISKIIWILIIYSFEILGTLAFLVWYWYDQKADPEEKADIQTHT